MNKQRMPTYTLTETQIIIRRVNNKAASSFIENCDKLKQTLQRREKYPLPLDRSLELEQLDKLMSHIAQQPKTLYWINRSLNIAQTELQNITKYLNWNKDEWKRWTKILNFLQTKAYEIDRKCQKFQEKKFTTTKPESEMETFIAKVSWLVNQQRITENHPKTLKRSLTLVILEMLQQQISKYPTYSVWAYQTVVKFWDMPHNSNIKQCWTEQEWHNWLIVLRHITLNLPNDENIVAPA
jgi:hypothetical protein